MGEGVMSGIVFVLTDVVFEEGMDGIDARTEKRLGNRLLSEVRLNLWWKLGKFALSIGRTDTKPGGFFDGIALYLVEGQMTTRPQKAHASWAQVYYCLSLVEVLVRAWWSGHGMQGRVAISCSLSLAHRLKRGEESMLDARSRRLEEIC